jgi:hypothetical protein
MSEVAQWNWALALCLLYVFALRFSRLTVGYLKNIMKITAGRIWFTGTDPDRML